MTQIRIKRFSHIYQNKQTKKKTILKFDKNKNQD